MMYFLKLGIQNVGTFILVGVFYYLVWITDYLIRDIINRIIINHHRGPAFWTLISFRAALLAVKIMIVYYVIKYIFFTF